MITGTKAPRAWPVTTLDAGGFHVVSGVHEPASILKRHFHDSATICCVQRGRFTEYYSGKAVDCDRRTLKVTPAGEPHWNHFSEATTCGIRIDVDDTRFADTAPIARLLGERQFLAAGAFAELTGQLVLELQRADALSALATEGVLLELLARMARAAGPRHAARPRWLLQADDFVRESYHSPLSIGVVAEAVGVRPATLAPAYRRVFGCTIAQRVRRLRLDFAANELTSSESSIAEIAVRAGFYDQSHFSNAFRAHFGVTPGVWRRQAV